MATDGDVGLTIPTVVVTVCPTTLTAGFAMTRLAVEVAAKLKTAEGEETEFITELTTPNGLDMTILDCTGASDFASEPSFLWFTCETAAEVIGPIAPCLTKAETVVPFPFCAMLATM